MVSKIVMVIFYIFLCLEQQPAKSGTWIRAGYYWYAQKEFPISDINSTLFTHLICGFAQLNLNSSTFSYKQLSSTPFDELHLSTFTDTVRKKNPSITTLLAIGGPDANGSTFSLMLSDSSYRKSFIDESIKMARFYGFQGLDFAWLPPNISSSDMFNLGILFKEWRAAVNSEATNSTSAYPPLILTMAVKYSPSFVSGTYPVDSMQRYLNWVHVVAHDYSTPNGRNFTGAHAALYDPTSLTNTDCGIRAWTDAGLAANKMVLCVPYYGYAWTLVNPEENGIGAPATGPALQKGGSMKYKEIKNYIKRYGDGAKVIYSSTYVVNYCTIGSVWIGFDDVEVVRMKVSYIKEKGLLGYFVWQVSFDDNWVLSQAAAQEYIMNFSGQKKRSPQLFVIILTTSTAAVLLILCFLIYYRRMTKLRLKTGTVSTDAGDSDEKLKYKVNSIAAAKDLTTSVPNLIVYGLADIEAATDRYSSENKLGKGGYGPVYKGMLTDGQVIAVKKLSKTSTQGFEEFKNEVILTAKLQHVNLVKLLGFCIDREEHMLIYEYMPNKSLDCYLFDPSKKFILDWRKRMHIIEGVCQGLLYLHEYSRLTIIHRDLKASNILLDEEMNPKIADFGLARIFEKNDLEANTERIVGTYGYVPPEYVKEGIYSTKSDVYSFGVLLLQIISGKKVRIFYGDNKNLSLLEYAYLLWNNGKDMEFIDPSLDSIYCSVKLMRCLQIALLCVQECPNDRPTMLEIFSYLQNDSTCMKIPKEPAFAKQTIEDDHQQQRSTFKVEICSTDDATVSDVVPR